MRGSDDDEELKMVPIINNNNNNLVIPTVTLTLKTATKTFLMMISTMKSKTPPKPLTTPKWFEQ